MLGRCTFIGIQDHIVWNTFVPAWTSDEMKEMKLFQFVYRGFELMTIFVIVGILWAFLMRWITPTPDRIWSVGCFLVMTGFDLFDFLIRGNSGWFYFGSYPVTLNVFMLGAYIVLTWNRENTVL